MYRRPLLLAASKRLQSNRRNVQQLLFQSRFSLYSTLCASFKTKRQLGSRCFSAKDTSTPVRETDQNTAIPGVSSPGEKFVMLYTCKGNQTPFLAFRLTLLYLVCETRSAKTLSKHAYFHGVVLVRCPHCENLHLIADRLGWFEEESTDIESILKAKGEHVKIVTTDTILELTDITGNR